MEQRKSNIKKILKDAGLSILDLQVFVLLKNKKKASSEALRLFLIQSCLTEKAEKFKKELADVESQMLDLLAENFTAEELQNYYNVY